MRVFYQSVLFFILIICSFQNLQAQDFWEQLPFPDTLDITCVAVNNEGVIFVTTNTSNIYDGIFRSTDSGQTWQQVLNSWFGSLSITINPSGKIYSIFTFEMDDVLVSSSDLGMSWDTLAIPNYGEQFFIKAVGADTLYVSQWKSNGAILLRSVNQGLTWEVLFETFNVSEVISDIEIAPGGDIYIGLLGFFASQGGIYKSVDNGNTWQYTGLQGYQVKNIEINSLGDIFIGARDMGTYAIYHDYPDEIKFIHEASNMGMVLNSVGYIYINSDWSYGTLQSTDNGNSFEWVSVGASNGPTGDIYIDTDDYVYGIYENSSNFLFKSIKPTYTALINQPSNKVLSVKISPNPVRNILTCVFNNNGLQDGLNEVLIVNSLNQLIFYDTIIIEKGTCQLNVAKFSDGIYTIILKKRKLIILAKFVKL